MQPRPLHGVLEKWERMQRKGWQQSGGHCPPPHHFIMRTIRHGEELRVSHTEQPAQLLLARVCNYHFPVAAPFHICPSPHPIRSYIICVSELQMTPSGWQIINQAFSSQ